MIKIAIDAMGGDHAPKEQIEGALIALEKITDIELTLFGDRKTMEPYLKDHPRLKIIQSDSVIPMGEKDPVGAIRSQKDSSMAMALSSVRKEEHDAIVSSGATQALIAGAHILVGRMKNIKRTAIAPVLPTALGKPFILLDSGGNVDIKPEFMVHQATFATVYAREVLGVEQPKLGLINIGTEEGKGREIDQIVYQLFTQNKALNFIGNVEPKDILTPPCDILISDGFTANIVMKTIEGTAKGMGQMLKEELKRGVLGKLGLLLSLKNLKTFKRRMSLEEIGGAMIYGLRGVVIKAQGSSKAWGFYNAIRQAAMIVRQDVLQKVSHIIEAEDAA
jgi:glycerol-3-phosphate acyltransferase PlsX